MEIKSTEHFSNIFNTLDAAMKNPRKYIHLIQIYIELYAKNISVISSKRVKLKVSDLQLS